MGQGGRGALGVLVVVEVVVDVLLGRAVGVLGVLAAELDAMLRSEGTLKAARERAGHAAPEERKVADRAAQGPAAEVVGAQHDAVAEAPRPGEGRVLELARAVDLRARRVAGGRRYRYIGTGGRRKV